MNILPDYYIHLVIFLCCLVSFFLILASAYLIFGGKKNEKK